MMTKKLIVNADDFGQSDGINTGIIRGYEEGIVTSTSLMVRYRTAIDAADYAAKHPDFDLGLHIDLGEWIFKDCDWVPIYEVIDLNDLDAVQSEINNQLNSFIRLIGRPPSHIDSHQHVHMRDSIRPLFIQMAKKLKITLRRCNPVVQYCGEFYGQLENAEPFHEAISEQGLSAIIKKLASGYTEMACHPSLFSDIETMYRNERKIELNTLCNKNIIALLAEENVELCSFRDILLN